MIKKLCLILLLLVGCTPIKEKKDMNEPIRILCYGDSNTWGFDPEGFRYAKKDLWTTQLENRLGENYKVINAGLNGRTTALDVWGDDSFNGLTDLPDTLDRYPDMDVIIFMLGTNDCYVAGNAQDIKNGMEALIQYTKENYKTDTEIVIVVPAGLEEESYPAQLSRQLAPLYQELADQYDCLYLDGTNLFELSKVDGVHLSKQGHKDVAQALLELFKENPIKS